MDPKELIGMARAEGRGALTEAESKAVLKAFGIPVGEEIVVSRAEDLLQKAQEVGYPVVLKGLGHRLSHKTERGLVKLSLKSPREVQEAADQIAASAGGDLEGFLLQPMLIGRREFVAGLFCDSQFGPVVMFGLGGIQTEAIGDVVFRIAPIDAKEAAVMIGEIHASLLLGPFRGEAPADRTSLVRTLVGLSRLAMEMTDVTEVDINPLIVGPDGAVTAVDALIIAGERPPQKQDHEAVDPMALRGLFYPRSIAFVGASAELGKWGHMLPTNVIAGGYEGDIYLVNPKGQEIAGRPVYKNVTDIPGRVDLAVVTIPAARVPELIPQLQEKGITKVLLVSSGFGETGAQGKVLERDLVRQAREAGILILGPNTMGICNPHIHFYCTGMHVRPRAGSTTLVAQSGNLGTQLLTFAESEGIGIRAFGGSGNEAMITIEDYMDAFAVDNLTRTVVLYVESIKDGRRFLDAARRVARKKPIVILKGGRTEAGHRAAASHTGALASNIKIFRAACEQVGIVLADHSMDLLDLSVVFSALPLPKGNRVGILTLGGGWGVVATDLCSEYGLTVPHLSREIIDRIDRILPPYWSRTNPIDLVAEFDPEIPKLVLEELLRWDGCDAVIHLGILGKSLFAGKMIGSAMLADPNYSGMKMSDSMAKLNRIEADFSQHAVRMMQAYQKPVLGVGLLSDENTRTIYEVDGSPYQGVSFLTPERAAKALAKMHTYQHWLDRQDIDRSE